MKQSIMKKAKADSNKLSEIILKLGISKQTVYITKVKRSMSITTI
jgi:hypothetical protein